MTASASRSLGRSASLCIVAFSALCGSVSLIYPFGRDQGSYGYAGWVLLDGGMPYRDVFILKPPMTPVVHGLAMGLFGVNTWAIRALDIGWTAASALLIAAVSLELWERRDAAIGAGLAWPFLYYQIDYWNIAQTDGWMTLPCMAAVWAMLRARRAFGSRTRSAIRWWLAAGAFAGIAVIFKYTAAAIGLPMIAVLAWTASTSGRRAWIGIAPIFGGGLLVLSACWAWLAATGSWTPFIEIQVQMVIPYAQRRSNASTLGQTLERLIQLKGLRRDLIPLFWAAPLAFAPAALACARGRRGAWWALGVALSWWLAAIGNVAVQGKFFDYHYLPLTAPSALIFGLGSAALLRPALARLPRRPFQAITLVALIALSIAATPLGGRARDFGRVVTGVETVDAYIASRREYSFPSYRVDEIRRVSKLLQDTTGPDAHVLVWAFEPTINVRARRHSVSRFPYNGPFRPHWRNPEHDAELMQALRSSPPNVIVVGSGDRFLGLAGTYQDSAAILRNFVELNTFVKNRYLRSESVGRYSIWRLRESAAASEPEGGD